MPFYFDSHGNIRLSELDRWPWLIHAFSTRAAGSLKLPENLRPFLQALGAGGMELVTLRQLHSAIICVADDGVTAGRRGDSLVAARPGVLSGIKTADCLPVLLVDSRLQVVAAAHAGWRGLARRIVEKTVGEMRHLFQCEPADLTAVIGPGIQACCFEVGHEVLEEFRCQFLEAEHFCYTDSPNPAETRLPRPVLAETSGLLRPLDTDRGRVDLAEAARRQLIAAGLPGAQIFNSGLCTACDRERFYSYRREKEAAGRMLAVIGVRPPCR